MRENGSRSPSLVSRIGNLVGAGVYLLTAGLLLEVVAVLLQHWVTCPFAMTTAAKILSTTLCLALCFLGTLWFHRSMNLVRVHLMNGKLALVTTGAFAFIRHPLRATIILTIPPLFIIWLTDLLVILPWALLLIVAHALVRLEERRLVNAFGQEYELYRSSGTRLAAPQGCGTATRPGQ